MHRDDYLTRMVRDFEAARALLSEKHPHMEDVHVVAATLVVAARLEAIEDALIAGFPIAGEGA